MHRANAVVWGCEVARALCGDLICEARHNLIHIAQALTATAAAAAVHATPRQEHTVNVMLVCNGMCALPCADTKAPHAHTACGILHFIRRKVLTYDDAARYTALLPCAESGRRGSGA